MDTVRNDLPETPPASQECSAKASPAELATRGVDWLLRHQNEDGGWGDTVKSYSNISTTALCWSALGLSQWQDQRIPTAVSRAEDWLIARAGGVDRDRLSAAIVARYGKDRTFSIPILTMCALCGRLGRGRDAWRSVMPLPFEVAALPRQLFKWVGLPVVSYALPALIAIGQVRHHHRPTYNPLTRLVRWLTRRRTLAVLTRIQPTSGGFLEAAPLTSFVVMSLAAMGLAEHPVATRGLAFLVDNARQDGSWPIDTNLSIWTTTLAVHALTAAGQEPSELSDRDAEHLSDWLRAQQYQTQHPYTGAAPGGWAWTDLSGGVPDADDTPGALLALHHLARTGRKGAIEDKKLREAAAGCRWLLNLQNRDGGMPTFCRGWGTLAFDRSSQDLTAHTLRAWCAWQAELPEMDRRRIDRAIGKSIDFLLRSQRKSGAWVPLWFGNQDAPDEENMTYGTTRVLLGLEALESQYNGTEEPIKAAYVRAVDWVCAARNKDGGWGGAPGLTSSIEETALSVDALSGGIRVLSTDPTQSARLQAVRRAVAGGVNWLIKHTGEGTHFSPTPIGFYFAKLWYFEELYPLIFTVGALTRARVALGY